MLSLIGGMIGILLGWFMGFIVGRIAAATGNPFSPAISLDAILLATLFSTAVGLVLRYLPGQPGCQPGAGGSLALRINNSMRREGSKMYSGIRMMPEFLQGASHEYQNSRDGS